MIDKNRIHPFVGGYLNKVLDMANKATSKTNQHESPNVRDFGSNSSRSRMVTEKDHIYQKSLDVLVETRLLEMRPGKARIFGEWLELNFPETFASSKIVLGDETTTFILDTID